MNKIRIQFQIQLIIICLISLRIVVYPQNKSSNKQLSPQIEKPVEIATDDNNSDDIKKYILDVINYDIFKYFDEKDVSTPLKRKHIIETEKYKILSTKLENEKANLINKWFFFYHKIEGDHHYDIKSGRYVITDAWFMKYPEYLRKRTWINGILFEGILDYYIKLESISSDEELYFSFPIEEDIAAKWEDKKNLIVTYKFQVENYLGEYEWTAYTGNKRVSKAPIGKNLTINIMEYFPDKKQTKILKEIVVNN
jgi:hypothetical protein